MGRAMIIITMGLLVALGYTFFGMKTTGQTMNQRNLNTYNAIKAKNIAHTGIQIAIEEYNNRKSDNDSSNDEFSNFTVTNEGATLSLTVDEDDTDPILRVTSVSNFQESKHEVISTFNISQNQQLVPKFAGAISKVGNQPIDFDKYGNSKVSFNGHPPDLPDGSPSPCANKPGLTVNSQNEVAGYEGSSSIDGDPPVGVDDNTKYQDISDLVDELEPYAINVEDKKSFVDEPSIYFINSYTRLNGNTTGSGIMVVRNNATLDIDTELFTAGTFKFDGLVILEDGSDFRGRGTADIKGTIIAASNSSSSSIDTNGDFNAWYDCKGQEKAEEAVNSLLPTTIYERLSIYE